MRFGLYNYSSAWTNVATSSADVSQFLPQIGGFTINPNPSSGAVTISLPIGNNSTIEIYDVLGNLILRKQMMGDFVWSPESFNQPSANSVYIIRVTERETDEQTVVNSERLAIVK